MAPIAINFAEDSTSSNLAWCTEGRSDFFTREAILACAPAASGVYGLFNSDCQLFIGESANIQESLLRHQNESEFHSRHLLPTGFTFEPCAEELRKSKAAEMIAKFRPVLQTEAALSEVYLLSDDLVVDEPDVGGEYSIAADDRQFPEHDRRERPRVRPFFQVKRPLAAALVSALIAGALAIFYFDMPIDYPIRVQARGTHPASARAETSLRSQNAPSADTPRSVATQNSAATPAQSDTRAVMPSRTWSVQISAAPAKDIAETLIARLKANGYDGYIVPADVNGKTYFRVRVGPFDGREEAELARQSLAQQPVYRDAYLIGE